jgi:hypothetical protein
MYIFLGISFVLFTYIISEIFFSPNHNDHKVKNNKNITKSANHNDGENEAEDYEISDEEENSEDSEEEEEDAEEEAEDAEEEAEDAEDAEDIELDIVTPKEIQMMIEKNNKELYNKIIEANDNLIHQNMNIIIERQMNIQNIVNTLVNDFNKYLTYNIPSAIHNTMNEIPELNLDTCEIMITTTYPADIELHSESNLYTDSADIATRVAAAPAPIEVVD